MWWKSLEAFVSDLKHADADQLRAMAEWASEHEASADAPGLGRNPKGRRHFRKLRQAATEELDRRGLAYPEGDDGEIAPASDQEPREPKAPRRGKTRIMYIESKADGLSGPARIGRVTFSKRGQTIYYQGRAFAKGSGFKSNYYDVDTGDEYWISGPRKDGCDRLYGEAKPVEIDDDVREEYWREIRGLPERAAGKIANR
jgi:hypothetical protein